MKNVTKQIFSIGSGDCKLEILIAKKIKETGCRDFKIECSDISQIRLDRGYELAKKEGILVGMSSGAAMYIALKKAKELGKEKTVVVILPDTGERYLSTDLFE